MKKQKMRFISAVLAACMMTSVLPVNALALGGGTPENGVTAQENAETATTIPTTGMEITKGGIYEVKGDTYTRSIIVTSSEPVTINITGNVTSTGDPFVLAKGSGKLEINNNGFTVDCKNRHFLYTYTPADVTVDGGIYKTGGGTFLIMAFSGQLTLKNVDAWAEQASALTSAANVHVMDSQFHHTGVSGNKYAAVNNSATMTLNNVKIVSTEGAITNGNSATMTVDGGNYTSGQNYNCIKNDAGLFIIKDGTFIATGASCIDNNWGQVRINGGSFTTDAGIAVKNRGGLRLNGGTVEAPNGGTAIDISGESGDVQLNGGTIRNSVTGVRVADAGDSEIDLKAVTFENNTDDISLGNDQQINIKKSFAGTAKIRVDDPARGRQITTDNEDSPYQKELNLISRNEGYVIGYKKVTDGAEFRYLAPANGNIVNAENAKATADLGAGEQELDTATVVPKGTTVTVTANIPEGAEFLGWSAVCDDHSVLKLGDDQTEHFEMPGCNVTVEALYQGGNVDPVNPGGGSSSDVVTGIAAVALTGAAVWSIYETGTGIYRVLNMPGVPMPSNRAGLATLIWEKAGCPEPQTVKSFSDIDDADLHLRQAASWMEEKGLMDDVKENEFRPYRYVTKLQTCLVWDKAKEESLIS